jgi:inner membrane protein
VLEEPIVQGVGRVRIDDSVWRIAGPDLPAGAKVRVETADGALLKVVPA